MESQSVVVLMTCKDVEEARNISRALLEEKLIACANLVPGLESLFWWEGKIDRADEVLLIIKTSEAVLEKVIKRGRELHSYSVPEIIALPILKGNQDYLKWIRESVQP